MTVDVEKLISKRNELAEASDMARGFAGISKGTVRRNFDRHARDYTAAALLLDDWISGKPARDIETMSDADLLRELEA